MWAIIKFDKNNFNNLKKDLKSKLGKDVEIYLPKILNEKYKNNKLISSEVNLLGDYMFCFHNKFNENSTINSVKNSKGLKYFLTNFINSQKEITEFISKCKKSENEKGYLGNNFIDLFLNKEYEFTSGPFSKKKFSITDIKNNTLKILLGNVRTIIGKNRYLFKPI